MLIIPYMSFSNVAFRIVIVIISFLLFLLRYVYIGTNESVHRYLVNDLKEIDQIIDNVFNIGKLK